MYVVEKLIKLKGRDFYNYIKTESWRNLSSLNSIDDGDTRKLCEFIIKNAHLEKTVEIINEIGLHRFSDDNRKIILVAAMISGRKNLMNYFFKKEFICDGCFKDIFNKKINDYIFTENKNSFKDNFLSFVEDDRIKDKKLILEKMSSFPFKTSDFIYLNEKFFDFYTQEELKKRVLRFISERSIKIDLATENVLKSELINSKDFLNLINEQYNRYSFNKSLLNCIKINNPAFFLNEENFKILISEKINSVYDRSTISRNISLILEEFLSAMNNMTNLRVIKSLSETLVQKLEKDLLTNKRYFYSYNKINEKILNYSKENGFLIENEMSIKINLESLEKKEIEKIILFYKKLPGQIEKVIINKNIKTNNEKKVSKRL